MPNDPELRRRLAKEGRLWGLAFVCALVGAVTVWVSDAVPPGIVAFLIALAVLGPVLYLYERRRRT